MASVPFEHTLLVAMALFVLALTGMLVRRIRSQLGSPLGMDGASLMLILLTGTLGLPAVAISRNEITERTATHSSTQDWY